MTAATKSAAIEPLPVQTSAVGELRRIPLEQLVESPWNPRKHFDPAKLAETAESLRTNGQLTPIIVRPWHKHSGTGAAVGDRYEIGAGHRRFRAAPQADLTSLLAVVRPLDDVAFLELLTIENKQREDVTPLVHFAVAKAELKRRRQLAAKLKEQGVEDPWERERQVREAEDSRRKERNARWKKAAPALLKALAEKLRVAPVGANTAIGRYVLDQWRTGDVYGSHRVMPPGRTAEELVRHLAFASIVSVLEDDWGDLADSVGKELKPWGVEAKKIVEQVAPKPKAAAAKSPARKGKGK